MDKKVYYNPFCTNNTLLITLKIIAKIEIDILEIGR